MVATRKRSDSVQSLQDDPSAGEDDTQVMRRSSRLQTRTAPSPSPLPTRQRTKSRLVGESPCPSDTESICSVTKSAVKPRGRKPKSLSESESEVLTTPVPSKRKRNDSVSSIQSVEGEITTRSSSRNTPLKTMDSGTEETLTRSTRRSTKGTVSDNPGESRRPTRRNLSDISDTESGVTTPRRATRKSMKVSAEPSLQVVSEELKTKLISEPAVIEEDAETSALVASDAEQKSESVATAIEPKKSPVAPIVEEESVEDFTLVIPESPIRKTTLYVLPPASAKPLKTLSSSDLSVRTGPIVIPRGNNVSGRFWRDPKQRFSNNFKDKGLKSSRELYEKLKIEKSRVKLIEQRMRDEKKQKIEELRKRQQLNYQRKEANDRRGEVVQVIKNMAKLKTLSKKQKRLIQKRDTLNMKQ